MRQSLLCFLIITIASFSACRSIEFQFQESDIQPDFPGNKWIKASNVSSYGWNIDSLTEAKRFSTAAGTKSVMIIDNGKLIYSWENPDKKYYIASIRKSLLSTLFGYYIDSVISLNSTLSDYNIDDINPSLTNDQRKVTVEMLLKSSSGILHTAAASGTKNILGSLKIQPGKEFLYNNWDFNALGTIFEQRTGQKIFKIFNDSIATRIDMEDFQWETDGRYDFVKGSIHPAYHFDMTARDMARFGLLILNRGIWKGKQIINKSWIDTISSKKLTVPDSYGGGSYGYMWWIHDSGKLPEFANIPTDAFSAQGNLSQFILVIPSQSIVIVHRAKKNLDPSITATVIKLIFASKKQN